MADISPPAIVAAGARPVYQSIQGPAHTGLGM